MRALLRVTVAAAIAASLAACRDASLPTAIEPTRASTERIGGGFGGGIIIDLNQFVEITAGENFTCARRANGKVFCWGQNNLGQTAQVITKSGCYGLRSPICTGAPTIVNSSPGVPLLSSRVDAGGNHVCTMDLARAVWCWGAGGVGQLGTPSGAWQTSQPPAQVPLLVATTISAGLNSTCAASTNAQVQCWGAINNATAPTTFTTFPGTLESLAVGALHACFVLTPAREDLCFGRGDEGQGAHQVPQFSPIIPVPALFPNTVVQLSTQHNTTCAGLAGGTVQCAGLNTEGMLGNGNTSIAQSAIPVTVGANGVAQQLYNVSVGREHACALGPTGAAFCWGNGKKGQLGNGASVSSPVPVAVVGGRTYRAIAAGGSHTCAITATEIFCWGDNFYSQLGTFSGTPGVPVVTQTPIG
jgi:alpha-tubulin suppressor-like RCC1 family protein